MKKSWDNRAVEVLEIVGRYHPSGGGFKEASVVMVETQVEVNGFSLRTNLGLRDFPVPEILFEKIQCIAIIF